jgi:hypothetical protein
VCAAAIALTAASVINIIPSASAASHGNVVQIASDGIAPDTNNDYSWSMAWFKGNLYVGTSRDQACVENATIDFWYPGHGYYKTNPGVGVTCPADPYDMDLRAEIWKYSPGQAKWTMVYQSPTIDNPRAPIAGDLTCGATGDQQCYKPIARDIGYRGMVVYNNQLYIGDNTADEYIPEIAASNPPTMLRTSDGTNFVPVNGAPTTVNDFQGTAAAMGFRAMVVYQGHMYVTVIPGLTGDGVVERVDNPDGPTTTFTQISPSTMRVFELQVFANRLYAGTGDSANGYGVWKTDAVGDTPTWNAVITNGAGRGKEINSVVSMGVFQGKLYVGASGWYNSSFPASEEIRVGPGGAFDVVAGKARWTKQGYKKPLSSLPDGFGNIFNAHFWRQTAHGNAYFVGTNDWSYNWYGFPVLGNLLQPQFGFDIWGTCDGVHWWAETQNAFGDGLYNFGARTMVSTPASGFFVGSANHAQGTTVYRDLGLRPCTVAPAKKKVNGPVSPVEIAGPPQPPVDLAASNGTTGPSLTWTPVPGATSYQVLRSGYVTTNAVDVVKPPSVDGFQLTTNAPPTTGQTTPPVSVPTAFQQVGTTSNGTFTDTTAQTGQVYLYEVVAVGSDGSKSLASNVVTPQ